MAEAIAKVTGITAELIDKPITELVDILFIGGGIYGWDINKGLKGR